MGVTDERAAEIDGDLGDWFSTSAGHIRELLAGREEDHNRNAELETELHCIKTILDEWCAANSRQQGIVREQRRRIAELEEYNKRLHETLDTKDDVLRGQAEERLADRAALEVSDNRRDAELETTDWLEKLVREVWCGEYHMAWQSSTRLRVATALSGYADWRSCEKNLIGRLVDEVERLKVSLAARRADHKTLEWVINHAEPFKVGQSLSAHPCGAPWCDGDGWRIAGLPYAPDQTFREAAMAARVVEEKS